MPKKFDDAVRWAFGLIIVGAATLLLQTLNKISDSIDTLNVRVAVIVDQVATQRDVNTKQDAFNVRIEERVEELGRKIPRAKCRTH